MEEVQPESKIEPLGTVGKEEGGGVVITKFLFNFLQFNKFLLLTTPRSQDGT